MQKNIVAVIPARGGSKGVPNKNIRPLLDAPLVVHSIQQALSSPEIKQVFVSTDCDAISQVALDAGACVIERPNDISHDMATSESALQHAHEYFSKHLDYPIDVVVFLQCTSPIRQKNDISNAINVFIDEQADSLLSVVDSHRFLWKFIDGKAVSLNYDYRNRPRRQDAEQQFQENGSIYIYKPWVLEELNNRLGGKISFYPMFDESSIDIDTELDFKLAEMVWADLRGSDVSVNHK